MKSFQPVPRLVFCLSMVDSLRDALLVNLSAVFNPTPTNNSNRYQPNSNLPVFRRCKNLALLDSKLRSESRLALGKC